MPPTPYSRLAFFGGAAFSIMTAGCVTLPWSGEDKTAAVSNNPFEVQPAPAAPVKRNFAPAAFPVAHRVDQVGRKVLEANPQISLRPLFGTIGSPQPEVFHQETKMVWVTDSLVKQCKTDGELAAVLSRELGKMVAEREAMAGPDVRQPERKPPITMPIGNAGQIHDSDLVGMAERAKFERDNPRKPRVLPRPDHEILAKEYLEKAGYQKADLDAVQPLLRAAERNTVLERQLNGGLLQSSWTPR